MLSKTILQTNPKLDPEARLSIDWFKEEHRRKVWEKLKKVETEKLSEKHQKIGGGKKGP